MINPVIFEVGFFQFRYFSIIYAFGLIFLYLAVRRNLRAAGINVKRDELIDWFLVTLIYAVVGSRVYYVVFNIDKYFGKNAVWYDFLAIWQGGLAINGGLLFGFFALAYLCDRNDYRIGHITDHIVGPLLILQAIVRIGNFFNGELYGKPTRKLIGVFFRHGPAAETFANIGVHPVMLYESFLCIVGFLLIVLINPRRHRKGFITSCYLLIYSSIRLVISFWDESEMKVLGFDESLIFAILGMGVSVIWIGRKGLFRKPPSSKKQLPPARKWSV